MSTERSKLKKNLDKIVSQIVRKRDKWCVICGKPVQFNDKGDPVTNDCGHFLGRKVDATRWDLRNCNCQCRSCNWKHNDNPIPYYHYMHGKYGLGVVAELEMLYREHRKISVPELRELLKEMKELYRGLE
jgi:hypothetical protein